MTPDLESFVSDAVKHFWRTREIQKTKQGSATGKKDHGARGAVTGGKQLDGFIRLIKMLVAKAGVPESMIYAESGRATLPGFFRATKEWDLLVVVNGKLLATIEFKSQVGPSFGNNFNNRSEEAIGSATDLWTAYREGAFKQSPRPWLGYFMLLEEAERSVSPVRVKSPHFDAFPEFINASYAKRYELLCMRLVRERLYDSACLLLSNRDTGLKGAYKEPNTEVSIMNFSASLAAHVGAYAQMNGSQ